MAHPLDGARLKLARAQEHINAFGEESVPYLNSKFCRLDFRDEGDFRNVFLVVTEPPPIRLSAILGDCVHNIRASLDHLAWQLVIANQSTPNSNTAFPIFASKDKYRDSIARITAGMKDTAITRIEELQPYHKGDVRQSLLWFLYELDNEDKHRALNLTQGRIIPADARITTNQSVVAPAWIASGVLHDGAKVGAFRLADYSPEDYVRMEADATSLITLEDSGPWGKEPIINLAVRALNYVGGEVFPRFESYFP
jgi:hypothetical protein